MSSLRIRRVRTKPPLTRQTQSRSRSHGRYDIYQYREQRLSTSVEHSLARVEKPLARVEKPVARIEKPVARVEKPARSRGWTWYVNLLSFLKFFLRLNQQYVDKSAIPKRSEYAETNNTTVQHNLIIGMKALAEYQAIANEARRLYGPVTATIAKEGFREPIEDIWNNSNQISIMLNDHNMHWQWLLEHLSVSATDLVNSHEEKSLQTSVPGTLMSDSERFRDDFSRQLKIWQGYLNNGLREINYITQRHESMLQAAEMLVRVSRPPSRNIIASLKLLTPLLKKMRGRLVNARTSFVTAKDVITTDPGGTRPRVSGLISSLDRNLLDGARAVDHLALMTLNQNKLLSSARTNGSRSLDTWQT